VHDESASIGAFHDALVTATDKRPDLDVEFVYVDDGSRDGSLDLLLWLRAADDRVAVIGTMLKLAADGILGFSTFPLRLISRLGLVISLLSVVAAFFVIYVRVFEPSKAVPGWAFIAVGMFLLSGLQLLMMGVIGSYLGRVYVE